MGFIKCLVLLQFIPIAFGAVSISPIVECSELLDITDTVFTACGTSYLETPSPAFTGNETLLVGRTVYEYTIVAGLDEGVNIYDIPEKERLIALENGIIVTVQYETIESCTVTVDVQDESTDCLACSHCGNETFIADCTNVPNGRAVLCESTAVGDIFFPLNAVALSGIDTEASPAPTPAQSLTTFSANPGSVVPVSTPTGKNSMMTMGGKLKRYRSGLMMMKMNRKGGRGRNGAKKRMNRNKNS